MAMTVENTLSLRDKVSSVMRGIASTTQAAMDKSSKGINAARQKMDQLKSSGDSAKMSVISLNQGIELLGRGIDQLQSFAGIADQYSQIQSRLGLIAEKGQTVADLQDKIYAAAERSRGSYTGMADAVSKLGITARGAFANNDQIIKFSETLNKAFVVSGASSQEVAAGVYQITQALASGKLQGDEFRSVMEEAPMYAQAIAKYTGKSVGELKKMSAEGTITADIMRNSLLAAATDIDAQFSKMPITFGQAWTIARDKALRALQPLFDKFSNWINTGGAAQITAAFAILAQAALSVGQAISFIADNWNYIEPILIAGLITVGLVAVQSAYKTAAAWLLANWPLLLIGAAVAAAIWAFQNLGAAGQAAGIVIMGVLVAIGAYQLIAWWPLAVAIVALAALVAAFYAFGGAMQNIFGFIGGIVGGFIALFYNRFVDIWNFLAAFGNFFGNLFNDPVYACKKLVFDLAETVISSMRTVAKVLDKVFGTNTAGALDAFSAMAKDALGKSEKYKSVVSKMDYMDVSSAIDKGNAIGKSISASVTDTLHGMADKTKKTLSSLAPGGAGAPGVPAGTVQNPINTKLTPDSKVGINGDVTISDEDLKFMRDVARTKFVNEFKTLRPTVHATFGDVRETADVRSILSSIADAVDQAVASSLS